MRFLSMIKFAGAAAFACSISLSSAQAIPLDDAGLDEIYSQSSFGGIPIDIRVRADRELVNPAFLDITIGVDFSDPFAFGELDDLFALGDPGLTLNIFFVDALRFEIFGNTIGIAQLLPPDGGRGNNIAVVNDSLGQTELVAHEIGHALGLDHETGTTNPLEPPDLSFPNLMAVSLNGNTSLTPDQVATIFNSQFVQGDQTTGFFVDVQPIRVVASAAVPVPASLPLLASGFLLVAIVRRRRDS